MWFTRSQVGNRHGTGGTIGTVKGMKAAKKNTPEVATACSIGFTWNPNAKLQGNLAGTKEILIQVQTGSGKNIKNVAGFTVNLVEAENGFTRTVNGCTMKVTGTLATGFKMTINGLNSGTKYTLLMQTKTEEGKLSKGTKVSTSTKKWTAPKLDKYNKPAAIQPGGGSTNFGWLDAVTPILPSGVSGTTSYEVGIWDAVKKEYLWFSEGELSFSDVEIKKNTKVTASIAGLPFGDAGEALKTLTTGTLTTKGKYVFGVRAVISDGDSIIAKSAALKVNVTVK